MTAQGRAETAALGPRQSTCFQQNVLSPLDCQKLEIAVRTRHCPSTVDQVSIRPMNIGDYDSVTAMMKKTDGVTFRDADSREATQRYLSRNPGLSFVALEGEHIVGCNMSGHDGRRGYLQHLVVLPTHRKRGIVSRLVELCLDELERLGIHKSHIDVLQENHSAHAYWESRGWKLRTDIRRYSFVRSGSDNA